MGSQSYYKLILFIAVGGAAGVLFFIINRWLQRKLRPRESGTRLLLYFLSALTIGFAMVVLSVFVMLQFYRFLQP